MAKLVINIIGAPGTRKSTTAFALFAELKKRALNCEMASEVAKEYVFEDNKSAMEYQLIVWAQQAYRLWCVARYADVVITDVSLLTGMIYVPDASISFCQVVLDEHHKYCNLNILMPFHEDDDTYTMVGRVHNFQESKIIHEQILDLFEVHNIPHIKFEDYIEGEIISLILEALEEI